MMSVGKTLSLSVTMWSAIVAGCAVMPMQARAQSGDTIVADSPEELIELFSKYADKAADVLITDAEGNQTVLVHSAFATVIEPEQVNFPPGLTLDDFEAGVLWFRYSVNPTCELKKEGGSWVLRPVGCTLS
jgi:hypothetical protein